MELILEYRECLGEKSLFLEHRDKQILWKGKDGKKNISGWIISTRNKSGIT